MPPLARAEAALRDGDTVAARAALLEAWRLGRSPVLAELIGLLDGQQRDGLRAQLDGVVRPRVLATLARLTALLEVDDPRVSAFALEGLERPPFTAVSAQPLLEAFVQVIRARRDVRLLARLKAIRDALGSRLASARMRDAVLAAVEGAAAFLATVERPAPDPRERALAERLAPLEDDARQEAALLDAVYANPADDAPRLVYADWLLERGHVRGEFIALQFRRRQGVASEADTKREAELLRQHGRAWLGPLAPVLSFGKSYSRTTFERGFLSTAGVILSAGKRLEPLWDAREWRTVEQLEGHALLEVLARAPLISLRGLAHALDDTSVADLVTAGRRLPLERLKVICAVNGPRPLGDLVRRAFPSVARLCVYWPPVPTVAELRELAGDGLHRLEVFPGSGVLSDLFGELRTTPLPVRELAFHEAGQKPGLVELRPTATGFEPR